MTRPKKRQFISEVAPNVVAAIMLLPDSLKISGYSRCPFLLSRRRGMTAPPAFPARSNFAALHRLPQSYHSL
ncbi:hypothetical protein JOS77_01480 [Chromobacterium haemolyticum]|nr:hypothetical protein JOS77_01480 [Chromobacterium haemolyticum]